MGKRIGIIGKTILTGDEQGKFKKIGEAIHRLGHTLVCVPTKGTVDRTREGVIGAGGQVIEITEKVIENSDHTIIYPGDRLTNQLKKVYGDIENDERLLVIHPEQLDLFIEAIDILVAEKNG